MTTNTISPTKCSNSSSADGTRERLGGQGADIQISVAPPGGWDSTSGNTNGFDFYSAFLHEVGHALGLLHVIYPTDLMHYTITPNQTAAQRITLLSGRGKAADGAIDIISASKAITSWGSCASFERLGSSPSAACAATIPQIPSGLTATPVINTAILLEWNTVYNATGYLLESSLNANTGFQQIAQLGKVSTYTHPNLSPNTLYFYRIRATNAAGASAYSGVVGVSTSTVVGIGDWPVPGNFVASLVPYYVKLAWTYSSSYPVQKYIIERSTNISFNPVTTINTPDASLYYIDRTIQPSTLYYYRIKSYGNNGADQSYFGSPITIRTAAACPGIPSVITGPVTPLAGGSTYSVSLGSGGTTDGTSFVWRVPAGWKINGLAVTSLSQTTPSVTLTPAQTCPPPATANICVDIYGGCSGTYGQSVCRTLTLTSASVSPVVTVTTTDDRSSSTSYHTATATLIAGTTASNYRWYYESAGGVVGSLITTGLQMYRLPVPPCSSVYYRLEATTSCGTAVYRGYAYNPNGCGGPLVAFPNPTSEILTIASTSDGTDTTNNATIISSNTGVAGKSDNTRSFNAKLLDRYNQVRKSGNSKNGQLTFDVRDLPTGIYYLHVLEGKELTTKQIVIQR